MDFISGYMTKDKKFFPSEEEARQHEACVDFTNYCKGLSNATVSKTKKRLGWLLKHKKAVMALYMEEEKEMNKGFLESLEKKAVDYRAIFEKLYLGVIETNKLIGIGVDDLTEEELDSLVDTYFKLRVEEGKEVEEALEKEDKVNLLNELIDVLVVSGYEYYLENDTVFECEVDDPWGLEVSLTDTVKYSKDLDFCTNTLVSAQDALIGMDCDVANAVTEVLRANLSKFPTANALAVKLVLMDEFKDEYDVFDDIPEKELIERQTGLLEKSGRYAGVSCEKVVDTEGKERLVFWSTTEYGEPKRKYLKPVTFKKCDLTSCWK